MARKWRAGSSGTHGCKDIQTHCNHYCSFSAKLSLLFTGKMGIKTLILQGCFEEQRKHL